MMREEYKEKVVEVDFKIENGSLIQLLQDKVNQSDIYH